MKKSIYVCEGKHHRDGDCYHKCISMLSSDVYPPINCLLFTHGYKLTIPKWTKIDEQEVNI